VPSQSFFPYCAELLDRFRDDERIVSINGSNFQKGMDGGKDSYYFSRYCDCWGWATWRRAWRNYDSDMNSYFGFERSKAMDTISPSNAFFEYWQSRFKSAYERRVDSWFFVWLFSCWSRSGLTCTPRVNLITNIGFGTKATHTLDETLWFAQLPYEELDLPLKHPSVIARNLEADERTDRLRFDIQYDPNSCSVLDHVCG
jgi:hypothetical protein